MKRQLQVEVGWPVILIVACLLLAVIGLLVWRWPHGVDPERVYAVCQQYANLDLSGMVQICKEVGFQQ